MSLVTAQNLMREGGELAGFSSEAVEEYMGYDRIHEFTVEDGAGGEWQAVRAHHKLQYNDGDFHDYPIVYAGGVRRDDVDAYDPNVAKMLAADMSIKAGVIWLPIGGGKGLVAMPHDLPDERVQASFEDYAYKLTLEGMMGWDIGRLAPDMGTGAREMASLLRGHKRALLEMGLDDAFAGGAVSGKADVDGGIEQIRTPATSYGALWVGQRVLKHMNMDRESMRIAIVGRGNVGGELERLVNEETDHRVVYLGEVDNGIYNPYGIVREGVRRVYNERTKRMGLASHNRRDETVSDTSAILTDMPDAYDILVLAGAQDAITSRNMRQVQLRGKTVWAPANGAVSDEADIYLTTQQGVAHVPDVLQNPNGANTSYDEARYAVFGGTPTLEEVNKKNRDIMEAATDRVWGAYIASRNGNGPRTMARAAFMLAMENNLDPAGKNPS